MSHDKQYPLTETKRKELRSKGIVPYSTISVRTLFLACLFAISGLLFVQLPGNFFLNQSYTFPEMSPDIDVFNSLVFYMLSGCILGFSLVLLLGFIQTNFLILPYRKYKSGIKVQQKRLTLNKQFQATFITMLLASILGIITALFLHQFFNTFLKLEPQPASIYFFYILRVLSFEFFLYGLSLFLVFLAVLAFIYKRVRFLEEHKMSRVELLEEMRDS